MTDIVDRSAEKQLASKADKPKEPLVAVLWTQIFPGLGHVYAGRRKLGLVYLGTTLLYIVLMVSFFVHPDTQLSGPGFAAGLLILAGFVLFLYVDAYRSAKSWNAQRRLTRNVSGLKKSALIFLIVIFTMGLNPSQLLLRPLALSFRENGVHVYRVAAGGMEPTIPAGERVLADRAIYRRSEPQRGDIVVFAAPTAPDRTFIQRIAGLPGDRVEIRSGRLLINGVIQDQPPFDQIVYENFDKFAPIGQEITVPEDSYYMLGDTSISSNDSRVWGFVPKKSIQGKVYRFLWSAGRAKL